jgi:hypothetical protein
MAVTVNATAPDGTTNQIALTKTGPDTGTATIANHQFKLRDIHANGDGTGIVCTADVLSSPTVTVTVHSASPPKKPFLRVAITGTPFGIMDSTTNYTVTAADLGKLQQFIVASAFPPTATA